MRAPQNETAETRVYDDVFSDPRELDGALSPTAKTKRAIVFAAKGDSSIRIDTALKLIRAAR